MANTDDILCTSTGNLPFLKGMIEEKKREETNNTQTLAQTL